MAGEFQFGIDDAKAANVAADGTVGPKTDILGVSSLSMGVESDSVEHRGDNTSLRIRKTGKRVTGSVEQAATQIAAYAIVSDGSTLSSGVAPNIIVTYSEPSSSKGKTYQLEAQAADVSGATRFTILKATTTGGPNFEWAEGEFSNPSWDYEGVDKGGNLFTIGAYDTETAIV